MAPLVRLGLDGSESGIPRGSSVLLIQQMVTSFSARSDLVHQTLGICGLIISVIIALGAIRPVQRPNGTITPPVPVPALLVSNRAPTNVEAELIRNSIATANLEIERLKRSQPRATSGDFARQINIYKRFIRLQSALLLRQLPPSILKTIFLYFTEGDEKPLSNEPPWILGQVCRQWRGIALGTPHIWRRFPPVHLGSLTKRDVDRIYTCFSELLHRRSGGPISFFLHSEVAIPLEYPIIRLLVAHCRQWENISLEVSGVTIRNLLEIEGQLNSLHSLEFSLRGRGEPVVKLFESAPRLRTVRVNSLVSPGMLRLPWMQLTTYEDGTAFGDGVSKAFFSCSSLHHLKFSPNSDEKLKSGPRVQWMPRMIMPHLTTLNIEFWDRRYKINTLFDNITLPALHTLVLKFSEHNNVTIVEMITRSLCDLKHLTFYGRDSSIAQYLVVMPALMTLDINDPNPELIEKLFQFGGGSWTVAPYLRSLTIHLSKSYKHPYLATLSRLAGIRCDTVSAFRDDQPSLPMLETFRVAVHGRENRYLSHFYYASLEPPTTAIELLSTHRLADIYALMNTPIILYPSSSLTLSEVLQARDGLLCAWDRRRQKYADVMTGLKNLLTSDPQAVAAIYLSGIDYLLYRAFTVAFAEQYCHEISGFRCEVARWRSKLTTIAPVLKWDWDDNGYLVYVPYEKRQLTRPTPEFKSQRLAYRDIPPDQLPAAKSFGSLKLEESLEPEVSRHKTMSGRD